MDTEKFINLMYKQKCLWDQSDSSYHLRDNKRKAWSDVSTVMEISVDELKKRWRGLRHTFGRELKKIGNNKSGQPESKWAFFKNLLFLQSTMSRRDLKGNEADIQCVISDEDDYAIESQSSSYSPSPSPVQSLEIIGDPLTTRIKRSQPDRIDTRLQGIEEKLRCFQGNTNDPDAQFLMSLLPFLKDIPNHRKLMVRTKIEQVLMEEQTAVSYPLVSESSSDCDSTQSRNYNKRKVARIKCSSTRTARRRSQSINHGI